MTGAITGDLAGDVANQGLQKKYTNDIMKQHEEQGQHNTQKQAPEFNLLSNLLMTLQLWRIQNMVFQTWATSSGAPGKQ